MKFAYDMALERLNDGRSIASTLDVYASALKRVVWVAEWHLPGCLSESFVYCTSKQNAIDVACSMAEGENGVPRGMKTALRKHGRFDSDSPLYGRCINTVEKRILADLI